MTDSAPAQVAAFVPRIELTIPAQSGWVRVARLTVAGVAARLNFPIDAVEDIKVAVSEAINNAIQHGPDGGGVPVVSIALEPVAEGLWIIITDQGRIDEDLPFSNAQPHDEGDELPEGGMGFLLMRALMDKVEQETGSHADTTVKMFKALPVKLAHVPKVAPQAQTATENFPSA